MPVLMPLLENEIDTQVFGPGWIYESKSQFHTIARRTLLMSNTFFSGDIQKQSAASAKLADFDLGLLAASKPESIERAVNRGSANASRCFELLSGAKLTDSEKEATNGEQFNKECPWLYDNYKSRGMLNGASSNTNNHQAN